MAVTSSTYMPAYATTPEYKAPEKDYSAEKEACKAKGGRWNLLTNTCDLPTLPPIIRLDAKGNPIPPETPKTETKPTTPETFTDSKTGDPSGIILPDGRTFLGLNPQDVANVAAGQQPKQIPGTNPVGTAAQVQRQQQLVQLAQQGLLTPEELQAIQGSQVNVGQALGAGALSAVPGIIGGAATGAVAGSLGGPVGVLGGAILGGLGAFLVGVRGSIKSQQAGEFTADQSALTKGQTFLRSLITDTNRNPQNAPENIALFYQTLNLIDQAHVKTFRDSQENLNKFLGNDGTEQLAKFQVFDDTMRQYYILSFQAALANPNPNINYITEEDFNLNLD